MGSLLGDILFVETRNNRKRKGSVGRMLMSPPNAIACLTPRAIHLLMELDRGFGRIDSRSLRKFAEVMDQPCKSHTACSIKQ